MKKIIYIFLGLFLVALFLQVCSEYESTGDIDSEAQQRKAQKNQEKLEKEKERERQDRIGKPNLMAICEIKVKPALKNPRSMDVDYSGSEYGTYNDGYAVNMKYYATNSFGAELMGVARCEFDKNGNLIKVEAP